ncbi:hypothetical protein SAMN05443637_113140 [Pseudonocardia thermophila]|jgi:hypothetical protein|uniref:Uncharacterized protein n=1 Tax=Pseudonocardia thermophila TaxID=1848 RepID=A0A1M6VZL8_PSETH|nr:hypothetical protein [Pseudonocardia thermophila]SHK86755.1 hypothetical protein SAMN05443637_113140 [Pseudonocardia thermophila]
MTTLLMILTLLTAVAVAAELVRRAPTVSWIPHEDRERQLAELRALRDYREDPPV